MTWNYQHIKNNDMEHISTNQRFYYFTSAEVISHQHLCFSHLECGAHSRRCWCEVELREYIFENPSSSTKPATPLTYNSCKKKNITQSQIPWNFHHKAQQVQHTLQQVSSTTGFLKDLDSMKQLRLLCTTTSTNNSGCLEVPWAQAWNLKPFF